MISFSCPKCQRSHRVAPELAGKQVRCPCGGKTVVPPDDDIRDNSSAAAPGTSASLASLEAGQPARKSVFDDLSPLEVAGLENSSTTQTPPPLAPYAPHSFDDGVLQAPQLQSSSVGPARAKELSGARWVLFLVGGLTVALHVFHFVNSTQEINELVRQGDVDQADAAAVTALVRVFYGAFIASGAFMLALGALVFRFPRTCTVLGFTLYLLTTALGLLLDPAAILKGAIIKIIVIIAFVRAIKSAFSTSQ